MCYYYLLSFTIIPEVIKKLGGQLNVIKRGWVYLNAFMYLLARNNNYPRNPKF